MIPGIPLKKAELIKAVKTNDVPLILYRIISAIAKARRPISIDDIRAIYVFNKFLDSLL